MTTSPPRSRQRPAPEPPSRGDAPAAIVAVKRIFGAETGNYFLLLGATLFLVVFGLVMVLSSSSVESFKASADFFTGFLRQGLFALVGIPLMLIASRMPPIFWKRWAATAMAIAVGLQLLVFVPGLGIAQGGNRNWVRIGWFNAQPSEALKVALVLWLALTLLKKRDALEDWHEVAMPIVPVAGAALGLVLLGGDLGTVIILISIVLGAVYFAGVRLRILAVPVLILAAAAAVLMSSGSGSRGLRIHAWLTGCASDDLYSGTCWQTVHGWWALASGGVFG
ncbi:MAG: FtsW/RodA/SpoVE family cell cycle protein, partial [Lacisediminihabitans sp.]